MNQPKTVRQVEPTPAAKNATNPTPPPADKNAFDALLKQTVRVEAPPPEGETSDPA